MMAAPDAHQDDAVRVADASALARDGARLHVEVNGRFVSVVRHGGELFCLDSTCYHTGGPLGLGDIEEVNGEGCLVCPWHSYQITLRDGAKYYKPLVMGADGKMAPAGWRKKEHAQRTHLVEAREDGGIYVTLQLGGKCDSDAYGSGHALNPPAPDAPFGVVAPAQPVAHIEEELLQTALAAEAAQRDGLGTDDEEDEAAWTGPALARWSQAVVLASEADAATLRLRLGPRADMTRGELVRRAYGLDSAFGDGDVLDLEDALDVRHVLLSLRDPGRVEAPLQRAYTPVVCASRAMRGSASEPAIELRIRLYPDGRLSSRLAALAPGDEVRLSAGPRLQLQEKVLPQLATLRRLVLLGGGSGITPMLQIAQNALDRRDAEALEIDVVYADATLARAVAREDLQRLAAEASAPGTSAHTRLRVVHVLSEAHAGGGEADSLPDGVTVVSGCRAHDPGLLQGALGLTADVAQDCVFAWCGPEGFVAAVRHAIVDELGVSVGRCVEFVG